MRAFLLWVLRIRTVALISSVLNVKFESGFVESKQFCH